MDDKDLKHILKLKPESRNAEQIGILKNHVKDIKVFKDFNQQSSEDQLNELCRNLHLQFLPENKILFEQGDRGDSFFIVLEGSVDIMVKSVDEKNGIEFNKKVASLKKGDSFGDLSLLYGAPRNATVKTKQDSYFIVMSKNIFDKIIKSHQVDKIHEIAQYYLNFPLFQNLDKITLMYFATKTITQKLQSKQVVVKQGDDTGRVYFVRSGRLKIIKKVYFRKLPENGFLTFEELIDEPLLTEVRKGFFDLKLLQLDIVEQGDVFCHHSVISHKPLDYTVITEVPCEVFIINEMDFLTLSKDILEDFEDYIKPYPNDRDLRKMYYESIRWKNYKSNVIDLIKQSKALQFSSLLRGAQITKAKALDQEYLHMNEKTIVYHKNFKNQNQQFTLNQQKAQKIQSRNISPQSSTETVKTKSKKMNNAVFTIKEEGEQTTTTSNEVVNVRSMLRRKLSQVGDMTTDRLSLPKSIKLDRFQKTDKSRFGASTQRQSLAGDSMDINQTDRLPANVQVEKRKDKTIYQFESKSHGIKVIYNQSKIAACGVLPPVQIKVMKKTHSAIKLNMQTANYPESQGQACFGQRGGHNQTQSKKRKLSEMSGYNEETDCFQTQAKRLYKESGHYVVRAEEDQDSTVESMLLLSRPHCSPFDLDQIKEESDAQESQELEEQEVVKAQEEPVGVKPYYELFTYEEYVDTMRKINQIQLDSCPIRMQPRQLPNSQFRYASDFKENATCRGSKQANQTSLSKRLQFFSKSTLYDQIEQGIKNIEINEKVPAKSKRRDPLKDLTNRPFNPGFQQDLSGKLQKRKKSPIGSKPQMTLSLRFLSQNSGVEEESLIDTSLNSVKAIYLR